MLPQPKPNTSNQEADEVITIHDEVDDFHTPIVVATCECGRTWLIWDGFRYKYSPSRWRSIKSAHMTTQRHLKGIADNA